MTAMVKTFEHFRDLLPWQRRYVLKHLTFKTGCLRRDLARHNPPIALATVDSIVPIGVAALLPADRRYRVLAHGVEAYVKPKYRGNGIGRKLIKALRRFDEHERIRWFGNA